MPDEVERFWFICYEQGRSTLVSGQAFVAGSVVEWMIEVCKQFPEEALILKFALPITKAEYERGRDVL